MLSGCLVFFEESILLFTDKSYKKYLQYPLDHDNITNGSLVKRLRRRPLTAETRVRFPYGLLIIKKPHKH